MDPAEPEDMEILSLIEEGNQKESTKRIRKRRATRFFERLWPNGTVPYRIDDTLSMIYNYLYLVT